MLANFLFRATRKAHHLTEKLHAWAQNRWHPAIRAQYRARGRIPLTAGYVEERAWFVEQQFQSNECMTGFAVALPGFLPQGYGVGLDERCIEWPWAMAHLGDATRILDAGSALNHPHILSLPIWRGRKLDIFTLAPETACEWQRGISYLYGDLRQLPYRSEEFDCVISISTLEHVGMDNSAFSGQEKHKEHATEDILLVLAEWRRILKPGGCLLLTVPYGRYEDHGIFQQFDAHLLDRCARHFAPAKRKDIFFLYSEKGWQAVEQTDCTQAVYAIDAPRKPEPDRAAAARAVSCCQWWI